MDRSDESAFVDLMEGLALTFKTKISKPLLSAYWLGLSDLPFAAVKQACVQALVTCKFMPVPRELRDLAGVMGADLKAIIAWNAVKRTIREVGSYRSVNFDDPAVNAAVRSLGGWARLCGTESEQLDQWTSKEFQRLYRELSARQLHQDLTRHLPGIFEQAGDRTLPEPPVKVLTGTAGPAPEIGVGATVIMLPGKE